MPSDLWNFACRLYAAPGVAERCLALQEQGQDVCLLLCACWLEWRGVACRPLRLQALQQQAAPWQHEVIAPLRQLRQQWRPAAQTDTALHALRERLKQLELDAEHQLLQRLEQIAAAWPGTTGAQPWLEALQLPAGDCHSLRQAIA